MRTLVFAVLLGLLALFASDEQKALSSEVRAEVHAQNLIDGGYYAEATAFLTSARDRYPGNIALLMFSGNAFYNLNDLKHARQYYMMALESDPNNAEAADFIAMIDAQESAKENKAVSELIAYLSDKGLDFLMIFIAFLGGEILAAKYSECQTTEVRASLKRFNARHSLHATGIKKLIKVLRHSLSEGRYRLRRLFSLCSFLGLLNVMTISGAVLIVWVFIEIEFKITYFLPDAVEFLDSNDIWHHVLQFFWFFIIAVYAFKLTHFLIAFPDHPEAYTLDTAEKLQNLALNGQFVLLRESCRLVVDNHRPSDIALLLSYCDNSEAREIIGAAFKKLGTGNKREEP